MIRATLIAAAAVTSVAATQTAGAHPYTTWKEDGFSSDAHSHINSGDYSFTVDEYGGTEGTVVQGNGYFTADGVYVTSYGYYLRDGTYVEGKYEAGSVFAGGAVAGNTTVTGGGIVGTYGSETSTTITRTTTTTNTDNAFLARLQASGGVRYEGDGTPYYCWCAFSTSGDRVPVYSTTGPNTRSAPAKHFVGGGRTTFDVTGYQQGFWRVGWTDRTGNPQYGWAHEDEVTCKRTLSR